MKSPLFIDTGYLLALVNTSDTFHQRALAAMNQVQPPFVTTEAVLTEVGNALARQRWRSLGVSVIQRLQSDPDLEIVTVTPALFEQSVQLYSTRPDKEWGLTDCISFVVMQERGLTDALTTDHHFVQAGFHSVL
jgi:uncharacterized protein